MRLPENIISTTSAPAAIGAYSQGIKSHGVVYFSGQIGLDPQTMEMKATFDEQLAQILQNIDGALEAAGVTRADVFKTTIFMTDLADFGKVNEAYSSFFQQPYPARSCVGVSQLPKGALIEIEVMASLAES